MAINHQGLLISGDLKGAKATIEALTGVVGGTFALATDTLEIGYHDGTNWHWSDFTGSGFDLEAEVAGASSATPVLADLLIFFLDSDGTLRKTTFTDFLTNLAVPELNTLYGSIDNEITNGNSHDHAGGDGAQIDHGGLAGIGDNDHPQYIRHALAGAANDFLIASGAGTFVKATLAQTVTLLDSLMSLIYAPIAKGVTNGDSHNHVGGDGAALNYTDVIGAFLDGNTVPAASTYHASPFRVGLATGAGNFPWPEAGVLSDASLRTASAQPGTGSLVATLYINNVASSIVITVAAGAGNGTFSDNTHTETIAAGDLIRWQFQNNASGASAQNTAISMKITKQTT